MSDANHGLAVVSKERLYFGCRAVTTLVFLHEKMLWRTEKNTLHDLGRGKFLEVAMEWKERYVTELHPALA